MALEQCERSGPELGRKVRTAAGTNVFGLSADKTKTPTADRDKAVHHMLTLRIGEGCDESQTITGWDGKKT